MSAMLLKVKNQIKVTHVSVISASGIYARAISELSATEAPRARQSSRARCLPVLNSVFSASFAAVASVAISLVSATVQAQSLGGAGAGSSKLQAMSTLTVKQGGGFESALAPANSQSANFLGQVLPSVEGSASFRIGPSSILNGAVPALSIARNVEETGFEGAVVEDALNFNLGVACRAYRRPQCERRCVALRGQRDIGSGEYGSRLAARYLSALHSRFDNQ